MAGQDFAALTRPVSADNPCGPDLDLAGDPDFANFVARAEGLFPASFFTRDDEGRLQPFDRTKIDFAAEFRVLDTLLETTRDLRLLTIYARLLSLNRDLLGFAACAEGIAGLVRDRWPDVNPKGEDGDYSLRGVVLQGLDDNASVVLPLQHTPLVLSRRAGAISYRSIMIANGEAKAREDEAPVDRGTIDRAFAETERDALTATAAALRQISGALETIRAASAEKAGYEQAVSFDRLPPLVAKMLGAVEAAARPTALPSGGPAAAASPDPARAAATSTVAPGRIASMADAREGLAALNGYFRRHEPSSPAAILVQQAQRLMGKSFPEVLRILVPAHADEARIQIGTDKLFGLRFDQFPDAQEAWAAAEADEGSAPSPKQDGAAPGAHGAGPDPARPAILAQSRADAVSLLDQISAYFRAAEPSSPIPLLTERARGMIERDFLSILKDVLPDLAPRRND